MKHTVQHYISGKYFSSSEEYFKLVELLGNPHDCYIGEFYTSAKWRWRLRVWADFNCVLIEFENEEDAILAKLIL